MLLQLILLYLHSKVALLHNDRPYVADEDVPEFVPPA
jgi:hypothetical protein